MELSYAEIAQAAGTESAAYIQEKRVFRNKKMAIYNVIADRLSDPNNM